MESEMLFNLENKRLAQCTAAQKIYIFNKPMSSIGGLIKNLCYIVKRFNIQLYNPRFNKKLSSKDWNDQFLQIGNYNMTLRFYSNRTPFSMFSQPPNNPGKI